MKKGVFTKILLKWHTAENTRAMPWKGEKDPYKIWLSEIILQQTRVEQGWAYYEKFVEAFPTIHDLAIAPEQLIFKLWEGLGYYSRCRNLIATAKKIDGEYGGKFPDQYGEILALKGIGPYTAAAIASFAFNLPHAVVDGNVLRVLSRYYGDSTPIDSTAGKKIYTGLADSLLDKEQAGLYNQAIMDFGAIICKPQNPLCSTCVQQSGCQAFQKGWVDRLPVKEKSIRKKERWFYYFLIETPDGKIYIRQRKEKDIWEDLYEFVLWETDEPLYINDAAVLRSDFILRIFGRQSIAVPYISRLYRQELSHQTIRGQFITIRLTDRLPVLDKEYLLIDRRELTEYAFPKFINAWLQDPTPIQSLF
ncbi:MAG TPA: A/G-specific adenine glycosylase [Puia sp.]|jgi:A/G-specific adenine glycosylase